MDFRPVRVVLTVLDKGEIEATRIAEEVADFLEVRTAPNTVALYGIRRASRS